jgi:hypothetical protein
MKKTRSKKSRDTVPLNLICTLSYISSKPFFSSQAGGDTTEGQGGVPAFVGFNAGNGTKSYEYKPFSQTTFIRHP